MEQSRIENEIEKLLQSVDRPGDFCAHGRLLAPMPRLEVQGAGALSFPVPEAQIQALVAAAERAPYGKGPETLVDRSVRDCWQIEPGRVRLAGSAWPETFSRILRAAAAGLGCAPERLDAQLHKLLIYEPGGFFSPHRDTEKADGMVATVQTPSRPVAGSPPRSRATGSSVPTSAAAASIAASCVTSARTPLPGRRASRCARSCAPTCTRPSIAAGWTSSA